MSSESTNYFSIGVLLYALVSVTPSAALGQAPAKGSSSWQDLAVQLSSESQDEVDHAIRSLSAIPNLDRLLTQALKGKNNQDRDAAYQTIHGMKRESLLPEVLSQGRKETKALPFLTLCSLTSKKTDSDIAKVMESRISSNKGGTPLSAGAKVAILSCFHQLGPKLPEKTTKSLLTDSSFEVRIAAAELAGRYRVDRKDDRYDETLLQALVEKPYQLRLTAISWIEKTPRSAEIRKKAGICQKDTHPEVQEACRRLNPS